MRLSNRNILLLIGIAVAVAVTLTTLVYKDKSAAQKEGTPVPASTPKKTSLNSTAKKVVEFLSHQVRLHR
jgi:hypothetical protein